MQNVDGIMLLMHHVSGNTGQAPSPTDEKTGHGASYRLHVRTFPLFSVEILLRGIQASKNVPSKPITPNCQDVRNPVKNKHQAWNVLASTSHTWRSTFVHVVCHFSSCCRFYCSGLHRTVEVSAVEVYSDIAIERGLTYANFGCINITVWLQSTYETVQDLDWLQEWALFIVPLCIRGVCIWRRRKQGLKLRVRQFRKYIYFFFIQNKHSFLFFKWTSGRTSCQTFLIRTSKVLDSFDWFSIQHFR